MTTHGRSQGYKGRIMRHAWMITILALSLTPQGCSKEVAGSNHDAVAVATGYHNSFVLLADGTVRAWGQSQHGQLGNGTMPERYGDPRINAATPVAVSELHGVVGIAAGHGAVGAAGTTAFAITESGVVYWWGADDLAPQTGARDQARPVEAPALKDAKKIVVGLGHACALMSDGSVLCWGSGYSGEIGNGKKKSSAIPVPVPGLENVVDVAAGASTVCAVLADGQVMCWGKNGYRQASPTSRDNQLSPVIVPGVNDAKAVGMAANISCAVHQDNRMSCWGENRKTLEVLATDVAKVEGFDDHICLRKLDGSVLCWGDNAVGQLGQGLPGKPSRAKQPLVVAGLSGAVDLSVGYEHACATTDAGTVFCWGGNVFGELGDASLMDRAAPVEVKNAATAEVGIPENGIGAVAITGDEQVWDDLPDVCTQSPALDMRHEALLRPNFEVQSASAMIDSKGTITVRLGNYPSISGAQTIPPRGDQLVSILYFIRVKDPQAQREERLPADVGRYGIATKTKRYTGAMSAVRNTHTSFELRTGVSESSSVELTHVGDDWVCGILDVTNKYGFMKGAFAAQIVK